MATIQQVMLSRLQENGMFENQAKEVLQRAIENEYTAAMAGRWNDEASGYPTTVIELTWLAVKDVAYEWIKERAPQAWFRPLFAPGMDRAEDKDAFVREYWEGIIANAADNLTEGSKQAAYSLKHLQTSADTTITIKETIPTLPSVAKVEFTGEVHKLDNGSIKGSQKSDDISKGAMRALVNAFCVKVAAEGVTQFDVAISQDPDDEHLLHFVATPRATKIDG